MNITLIWNYRSCSQVYTLLIAFAASKFGDFKRLSYRRSLILAVSKFNAL